MVKGKRGGSREGEAHGTAEAISSQDALKEELDGRKGLGRMHLRMKSLVSDPLHTRVVQVGAAGL